MAGTMNGYCRDVREEITELLLLDRPLPAPLARHVASCEGCAAEAEGVRRVMRTFERADSPLAPWTPPAPAPVPRPRRVRRRAAVAAGSVVLAACAALATVVVTSDDGTHTSVAAVRLAQDGAMVPHAWGTEIPVSLSGLDAGGTYRLMTGDAHGERLPAGSVHAGGRGGAPMHVRMTTAMPRDSITTLYVQDAAGHFVASTPVRPRDAA
ncbi:hypothetical protein [Streptomyces tremellae]|uniref:Zinc-finger domain-containing protein n=1 Tax=Streptomyces tremellae TaxID=1124239 RepID=A0ABP7GA59_9ACTN